MTIYKIYETNDKHTKAVILLAGWGNKQWMLWPFAQLLKHAGYHCVLVTYPTNILLPDVDKTAQNLLSVSNDMVEKIADLKSKGIDEVTVFGTSLGSIIALMVANKSPEVTKIILNTIGSDLAEAVWSWDKVVPGFKQSLLKAGYNLESLKHSWQRLAPINNIDKLSSRKLLIFLSKNDEIIPYEQGEKLVKKLRQSGYDVDLRINNHLLHLPSGTYNLINAKHYLKYLSS